MSPTAVKGYLTTDGMFFTTLREAAQYESTTKMRTILANAGMSEDILDFINENRTSIMEYLNPPRNEVNEQLETQTNNAQVRVPHKANPARSSVRRI
jgi:hypothetical protein